IYPNRQTRPGDNVVAPGRLLEFPDRRGGANSLTVDAKPGRGGGGRLLLGGPGPGSGVEIGDHPVKLGSSAFAGWKKKWAVAAERFELAGGHGLAITEKENQAGGQKGVAVTQDDPLPQSLYRVPVKAGSGMLLEIPLRLRK